jgi:hypothetical protein
VPLHLEAIDEPVVLEPAAMERVKLAWELVATTRGATVHGSKCGRIAVAHQVAGHVGSGLVIEHAHQAAITDEGIQVCRQPAGQVPLNPAVAGVQIFAVAGTIRQLPQVLRDIPVN